MTNVSLHWQLFDTLVEFSTSRWRGLSIVDSKQRTAEHELQVRKENKGNMLSKIRQLDDGVLRKLQEDQTIILR